LIKSQVFQERLRNGLANWQTSILPGSIVIGLVVLARLSGGLQSLEWMAFDKYLRHRPAEAMDQQVLVIGVNEADLAQLKTYPVPDAELAKLIQTIQTHQPAAIGVDIFRDQPVPPGSQQLMQVFQQQSNVVGIERLALNAQEASVKPSPALTNDQVGFANAALDTDGVVRRSLLWTENDRGETKESFSSILANLYLETQGIQSSPGIRDPQSVQLGNVEIPLFQGNTGGYAQGQIGGLATLINYRSGRQPFRVLSLADIKTNRFQPEWIKGKVVLVGMTAASSKDYVTVHAIDSANPALIDGVMVQAHAISQLINAAQVGRPLIQTWLDDGEYLWIIAWGGLGIILGWVVRSPLKLVGVLLGSGIGLLGMSYGLLLLGWWIPVMPPLLVFLMNGAGLTAFYRHDQALRSRIRERQLVINETFDAIHNGPLQTLSRLLSQSRDESLTRSDTRMGLQELDREVRGIYESMQQAVGAGDEMLYVSQDLRVNLREPMPEVLRQVYEDVLARNWPHLQNVKLKLVDFQPIDERFLDLGMRRDLCRFLEEAITNVGKHGVGTTRLEVRCEVKDGVNVVRVADNGAGQLSSREGMGTQQAKRLAKRLRGEFGRSKGEPQGMVCQLSWKPQRRWLG
jgi:CHASE2 domain-containing sensor protein/two-component sensor histidine kinase